MWPWGHAAAGYLAYFLLVVVGRRRVPTRGAVLAVLVGTQGPDLIDKPLSWTFDVLPSGRSLGHSLLTATVLVALVAFVLSWVNRTKLTVPFAVGYVAHLLTDLSSAVLQGEFAGATFLLWPILPSPTYEMEPSFTAHLAAFELTPRVLGQTALFVVAAILIVASLGLQRLRMDTR